MSFLWALFTVGAVLLWPTRGSADSRSCEGPEACCPAKYANAQARAGRKERGQMLDRRSRVAFPSVLALAMVLGVVRSVVQAAG